MKIISILTIFYKKTEILISNIVGKNQDWFDFFSFYLLYEGLNQVFSNSQRKQPWPLRLPVGFVLAFILLVFSELPSSVVWCLTLVWENSHCFKYFFCSFLSFFSFWQSQYIYVIPFCNFSQSLDISFCISQSLSSFLFSFSGILLICPLAILSSGVADKLIKGYFHSCYSVLLSAFFVVVCFSQDFHLHLHCLFVFTWYLLYPLELLAY